MNRIRVIMEPIELSSADIEQSPNADWKEEHELLNRAIQSNPENPYPYYWHARLYCMKVKVNAEDDIRFLEPEDFEEGIKQVLRSVELTPDHPSVMSR